MPRLYDVLAAIADEVIAERDALIELDSYAGDGDFGITMEAAAIALKALLPELASYGLSASLKRIGGELARKAPSSGGTLIATGFLRAGRAAEVACAEPTARLATLLLAAQQGIQERGKASLGDRTMLDALAPAVGVLQVSARTNEPIGVALSQAAAAATAGAEATRTMRPRVGRSSWMADRAEGHVDPGARLVALVLSAAAREVAR